MGRSLAELEAILRNRICSVCSDRTVEGQCGLESPADCALFALLPQVAQAVQSTQSNNIQDYIEAIRKGVCTVCSQQAGDGSCETRQQVQCALDAYLLLVVDVIEEALGVQLDRSKLHSIGGAGEIRAVPQMCL